MSYSSVDNLEGERKPRKPPARELDAAEVRVLGALIEKQLATPEYYPLTLNALVAACNQKSSREPVMELAEADVQRALDRLQDEKLVWKVLGGRATRYDHNLDATWQLDRAAKAIVALLFLRGAQTAGELRSRADRMHEFGAIDDVEATLQRLAPLVAELPRRPGQKEARWTHMLSGVVADFSRPDLPAEAGSYTEPLSARVQRLEEQVATLTEELHALKTKLGE
ncbi:MAG: YceH family protein [Acidobacteriota bacterium]